MAEIRMRAGDADRERVVEQLNRHLGEGRLDVEEFDRRVAAAYAAVHVDELPPLLADLPAEPNPERPHRERPGLPYWWAVHPLLVLLVVAFSVAAVVHGHPPVLALLLLVLFARHRAHGRWNRAWGPPRQPAG